MALTELTGNDHSGELLELPAQPRIKRLKSSPRLEFAEGEELRTDRG